VGSRDLGGWGIKGIGGDLSLAEQFKGFWIKGGRRSERGQWGVGLRGKGGARGFWGREIKGMRGWAGGVQTLVLEGPISKGVYTGGAPPVLKHQARLAPLL